MVVTENAAPDFDNVQIQGFSLAVSTHLQVNPCEVVGSSKCIRVVRPKNMASAVKHGDGNLFCFWVAPLTRRRAD